MRNPRPAAALALSLLATAGGCAMFTNEAVVRSTDSLLLPPVKAPPEAVQLELVYVERPVSDPLLGRSLWTELDQMAGIPHETRLNLLENGFRVAMCGSQPPPQLAELLKAGLQQEYDDPAGFWSNRRIVMRDGATTDVMCSHEPAAWDVDVVRDGVPDPKRYERALGFLRVDVSSVQDGWVEVQVCPEVHFGASKLRHEAAETGWRLKDGQNIEAVPGTAFRVHMNLNEMLVLSAAEGVPKRVGNRFFRRDDDGRLMQRVVVLRAAAVPRSQVVSH